MKVKSIMALIVCTIAVAATLNVVYAGNAKSAQLTITDANDVVKGRFDPGETIKITWHSISPPGATVDVWIEDSDEVIVYGPLVNQPEGSTSWSTDTPGYYYVYCTGAKQKVIAVGSVHVIPESILGTLMATAAGFAAFGAFRYSRSKDSSAKLS